MVIEQYFRTKLTAAGEEAVHPINWKKKFAGPGVTELRRLRKPLE